MTGSGAAQSLRPVCIARRERTRDGIWCRVRELNPHTRNETPESLPVRRTRHEDFHFGCAPARALPSEAASRCTRPDAGRAHPAPRTPRALRRRSAGTHPKWKKNKKARILCGIRASGNQSAARRVVRRGGLPDRDDPRTRDARAMAPSHCHLHTAGQRSRTRAGRRGLGRCEGRSGWSRWLSWFVSSEGPRVSGGTSCKESSLSQATARSVNSLSCLRKRGVAHRPRRAQSMLALPPPP